MALLLNLLNRLEELPQGESIVRGEQLEVGGAEEGKEGGDAGGGEGQAVGERGSEELLAEGREGKEGAQVGDGWGKKRREGAGGEQERGYGTRDDHSEGVSTLV